MTSIIAFENDNGIIIGSDTMVVNGNYVDTRNKYVEISKDIYIFVSGNAAALDALGFIYGQKDKVDKKFIDTGEFNRGYVFRLCQRVNSELNVTNTTDIFNLLIATKKGMCIIGSSGFIIPTPKYSFHGIGVGKYATVAYMDSYACWSDVNIHKCPITLLETPMKMALEYTENRIDAVRGCNILTISKDNQ